MLILIYILILICLTINSSPKLVHFEDRQNLILEQFSVPVKMLAPCKNRHIGEKSPHTRLQRSAHFPQPHNVSFLSCSMSFSLCPLQYLSLTSFLPLLDINHLFSQDLRELCIYSSNRKEKLFCQMYQCNCGYKINY